MPDPKLEELADNMADKLLDAIGGFKPGNLDSKGETSLQAEARRAKLADARKAAGVQDMSGLDKASMLTNINKLASLPTKAQVGACGELAAYAYVNFAPKSDVFGTVYMFEAPNTKQKDDYHAFVVLCLKGPAAGTIDLPANDDAIIVDLWMNYAVSGYGAVVSSAQHKDALKNYPYDLTKSKQLYPPGS
jgi:hypothetical protein